MGRLMACEAIRVGGLNIAASTGYPIEEFQQLRVLGGLSDKWDGPDGQTGTVSNIFVIRRART